jgi:hypothetical protein
MTIPTDTKILAAVITASASIIAVALTYLTKLLTELADKRRQDKMNLMAIRNELAVNKGLSVAIEKHTRTFGFRFIDKVWSNSDTSSIYRRRVPAHLILEAYSKMQLFNSLNDRYSLISEDENYRNKDQRLAHEHAEMVAIAEDISKIIGSVLEKMH